MSKNNYNKTEKIIRFMTGVAINIALSVAVFVFYEKGYNILEGKNLKGNMEILNFSLFLVTTIIAQLFIIISFIIGKNNYIMIGVIFSVPLPILLSLFLLFLRISLSGLQ
jgi:membrane-associated HD superfamily phosphohydrolase